MTRLKVESIEFYLLLSILVLFQPNVRGRHFKEEKDAGEFRVDRSNATQGSTQISSPGKKENSEKSNDVNLQTVKSADVGEKIPLPAVTLKSSAELASKTEQTTTRSRQQPIGGHLSPPIDPGALWRGFYVFLGLTVLLMAYIVFRSFRMSKTHAQMVRKYGILAHRQDVEMRPLPLEEEDDEDTTVFDATNINTTDNQRQIL